MALRWAAEEADPHGAVVVAVLAWDYLHQHHADGKETFDPSYGSDEARQALQISLRSVSPSHPIEERMILDLRWP